MGEEAEGFWEGHCFCWWPFVLGEEKKAAPHRVPHSDYWAQDFGWRLLFLVFLHLLPP